MRTTTIVGAAGPEATNPRYTLTAQALHWLVAALMFAVLPLAWVMVAMPRDAPSRGLLFTLHKSIGLTILALAAIRLFWRAAHPAPPLPGRLVKWERVSALASHWLLYLILLGMPVSGYLLSASAGRPVTYFGLFTLPGMAKNDALHDAAEWMHAITGQWAVYALVLLHIAATAWHVAVRRDGVLERMLPESSSVP